MNPYTQCTFIFLGGIYANYSFVIKDAGVDITNEREFYKYQQILSRQLSVGDFLKVELRKTMALMMR